jgi:hypothetical protein
LAVTAVDGVGVAFGGAPDFGFVGVLAAVDAVLVAVLGAAAVLVVVVALVAAAAVVAAVLLVGEPAARAVPVVTENGRIAAARTALRGAI